MRFLLNLPAIFLFTSMAISGQVLPAQEKTKADHVIVFKSERRLILKQGDDKTPEGRYIIDTRNPNSQFYRSLHISYPSARDIARAKRMRVKPGGMIMIYGLGKEFGAIGAMHRLHDRTQGCIAVTNEEIDEIRDLVADGTPIDLLP